MVKPVTEIRRAEIVSAASNVLIDSGLTHLSYDMIAAEAGTSRQLIRHYYPDPEQLMLDLGSAVSKWYHDNLDAEMESVAAPDRFSQLLNYYFGIPSDFTQSKRKDDRVIDALVALSAESELIKTNVLAHYSDMHQRIVQALSVSSANLKSEQCEELAFQIVCLIYGHWKMVASLHFSDSFNQTARDAALALVDSYRD